MLGTLPERVRELYGLPYGRADALAYRAGVRALRTGRMVTPGPLRRGWNKRSFDLVARTERRRIERGRPTPQVRDDGPAGITMPAA